MGNRPERVRIKISSTDHFHVDNVRPFESAVPTPCGVTVLAQAALQEVAFLKASCTPPPRGGKNIMTEVNDSGHIRISGAIAGVGSGEK